MEFSTCSGTPEKHFATRSPTTRPGRRLSSPATHFPSAVAVESVREKLPAQCAPRFLFAGPSRAPATDSQHSPLRSGAQTLLPREAHTERLALSPSIAIATTPLGPL